MLGILPLFALANAGLRLAVLSARSLLEPVPPGIALGLLVGKATGVFTFAWTAVAIRAARLPTSVTWRQMFGASLLETCGDVVPRRVSRQRLGNVAEYLIARLVARFVVDLLEVVDVHVDEREPARRPAAFDVLVKHLEELARVGESRPARDLLAATGRQRSRDLVK